jgi:cobalt/nickel transport system ATP-binding protein
MPIPLIALQHLYYHYPTGKPILTGVNLSLFSGERIAIVGDNGSGKTTLLHLLLGLLFPVQGEIYIFGEKRQTEADFSPIRTRLGLLFQDADDQLFCPTVAEDVAFGPLNQGKTAREASALTRDVLQKLGLLEYENRLTHELSGGEKRLVALATVLAMQPDVLLLDEPTTGLDVHARQRLRQELNDLSHAMIIVSHDEAFLSQLSVQYYELKEGVLQKRER